MHWGRPKKEKLPPISVTEVVKRMIHLPQIVESEENLAKDSWYRSYWDGYSRKYRFSLLGLFGDVANRAEVMGALRCLAVLGFLGMKGKNGKTLQFHISRRAIAELPELLKRGRGKEIRWW